MIFLHVCYALFSLCLLKINECEEKIKRLLSYLISVEGGERETFAYGQQDISRADVTSHYFIKVMFSTKKKKPHGDIDARDATVIPQLNHKTPYSHICTHQKDRNIVQKTHTQWHLLHGKRKSIHNIKPT